jgi:hypothetical protein
MRGLARHRVRFWNDWRHPRRDGERAPTSMSGARKYSTDSAEGSELSSRNKRTAAVEERESGARKPALEFGERDIQRRRQTEGPIRRPSPSWRPRAAEQRARSNSMRVRASDPVPDALPTRTRSPKLGGARRGTRRSGCRTKLLDFSGSGGRRRQPSTPVRSCRALCAPKLLSPGFDVAPGGSGVRRPAGGRRF